MQAREDSSVFLLALISKGQRADLTQAERNVLRATLGQIADAYRKGAGARDHTRHPKSS